MRLAHTQLLSALLSVSIAAVLSPLIINFPGIHYFLIYSVFSELENVFLLTAISVYGLSGLVVYRLRHGRWQAVAHRVFFYCFSAGAVWVVGIVSLALLWVVPMALLLLNDAKQQFWSDKSQPVNF